jgi:hypothetical protein
LGEYLWSGCAASGPSPQPIIAAAKTIARKTLRIECSIEMLGGVNPSLTRISLL